MQSFYPPPGQQHAGETFGIKTLTNMVVDILVAKAFNLFSTFMLRLRSNCSGFLAFGTQPGEKETRTDEAVWRAAVLAKR